MVEWKQIIIVMAIIGITTTAIVSFLDETESNYGISPPDDPMSDEYESIYNDLKAYANISQTYAEDVSEDVQTDEGITLLSGASAISKGIIAAFKIIFLPVTIGMDSITGLVRALKLPTWVAGFAITIVIMTVVSIIIAGILRWRLKG